MSKPKKQHFIPKVYLKHFSASEDGLGMYVLDRFDLHKKTIRKVDSGNAIFWDKGFYSTDYFDDVYHLERFFSKEIEGGYNDLIKHIKLEEPIVDWNTKIRLFEWIFYGKFRSPVFRNYFEYLLTEEGNEDGDVKKLAKMAHLELFHDEKLYNKVLSEILTHFLSKRWSLLKTTDDFPFFTSDSPGFSIRLDQLERDKDTLPSPFWHNATVDSLFFFPLTKNYALEIGAYDSGSAPELNLTNTPVSFESIDEYQVRHLNYWTICTGKVVISSDERSLQFFEQASKSRVEREH